MGEDALLFLLVRGVEIAKVTLHVGEGTFAPVRTDEVEAHRMHSEHYELSQEAADAVAATRVRGGRVVAVGTTSCRVLETCAQDDRTVQAGSGESQLFLYPGRPLRVVDAMITNFHLPRSTLTFRTAWRPKPASACRRRSATSCSAPSPSGGASGRSRRRSRDDDDDI